MNTLFAVNYLGKILPRLGLFTSEDALKQWAQDNDPEQASFYEPVPMTVVN
jgi:hypothetical protein